MKIAARRLKVNDEAKKFFKPARFMSTDTSRINYRIKAAATCHSAST